MSFMRWTISMLAVATLLGGCTPVYRVDGRAMDLTATGSFGEARDRIARTMSHDPANRAFVLDRMKYVLMSLAEGIPETAETAVDELYILLRTQGVNAQAGFATAMGSEAGTRYWKGEPFEQAMAYHYIGLFDAMHGDWGNARAASENALFLLRDFSDLYDAGDDPLAQREALLTYDGDEDDVKDADGRIPGLGLPYRTEDSDFELGWVMRAIAARQTNQRADLGDALGSLRRVAPHLGSLADQIEFGSYNTVMVVDAGLGPQKVALGRDGVIAGFSPRSESGSGALRVSANGRTSSHPVVTDLNRMALDLKWNNLEDLRIAKSAIGDALVFGGAVVASNSRNRETQLAGLVAAGIGLLMKSNAVADTRHCELLPQRVYVALLDLPDGPSTVDLRVDEGTGHSSSVRVVRDAESADQLDCFYVRMPLEGLSTSASVPRYSNDATGLAPGSQFPYILGGNCVRRPSWSVLQSYQDSGFLKDMTLDGLIDLYRAEGIVIPETALDSGERGVGTHVLEGGNALYTPRPGSIGAMRLFHRGHGPYVPRSDAVRAAARRLERRGSTN